MYVLHLTVLAGHHLIVRRRCFRDVRLLETDKTPPVCVQRTIAAVIVSLSVLETHRRQSVRPKIFNLGNYFGIIASIKYTLKLIHFHP